jgi:hypothetical protein
MSRRDDDRKLLKDALRLDRIRDTDASAFEDMLIQLEENRIAALSQKQRDWVLRVLDVPVYENLVSAGKVPRGREVVTPTVLLNRPLKPPTRRSQS